MITNIINSHQPFLFKNDLNELCLLYCSLKDNNYLKEIKYFSEIIKIRPWQIKFLNLETQESYFLNFNCFNESFGEMIVFCNPHLIENELFVNIGFQKNDQSGIKYHFCKTKLQENISFFNVLSNETIFSGTKFSSEFILCNYKMERNLRKYNCENNNFIEVFGNYLDIPYDMIYKIQKIWNTYNFIFTVGYNEKYSSYVLDEKLNVINEIKNLNDESVYKCSILDDNLIYAVKNDNLEEESRTLILEN